MICGRGTGGKEKVYNESLCRALVRLDRIRILGNLAGMHQEVSHGIFAVHRRYLSNLFGQHDDFYRTIQLFWFLLGLIVSLEMRPCIDSW